MKQRVTYVGPNGRTLTCHASKLTPYLGEVDESEWAAPASLPPSAAGPPTLPEDHTP